MNTAFSDSEIGAFVDGELGPARAAALGEAMAADAALAARVQGLQQQRNRLAAAFALDTLDAPGQPPPARLEAAAAALAARLAPGPAALAPVASLDAARARRDQREAEAQAAAAERARRAWNPRWGLAAGLLLAGVIGVIVGRQSAGPEATLAFDERAGTLVARGGLEQALGRALASDAAAGGPVAVQLSFVDLGGAYCRTFSQGAVAGLACKAGERWQVQALAAAETAAPQAMRQAASSLPPEILSAVDRRAAGPTLDAAAERAARDRGWQR